MAIPALLARLFGPPAGQQAALRPLWHRVVALARVPAWYRTGGVADSLAGRFDVITLVLALVLLRMEAVPALALPAARLTELFVEDMDGQLRESGVGDLVVGKHIGRLMGVLGGRLGALRAALAGEGADGLPAVLARNLSLRDGVSADAAADMARALAGVLAACGDAALLAGDIPAPKGWA